MRRFVSKIGSGWQRRWAPTSAPQGTTVRLYLPRAEAADTVTTAPRTHVGGDLRGDAIVLVVEDDDLVRRFAAQERLRMEDLLEIARALV